MIKAEILISKLNGKYDVLVKQFNDERHLDNYVNFLYRKNVKVVGYDIIPEETLIQTQNETPNS
jgi:hypothetical protein